MKQIKEIWSLNAAHDSRLGPVPKKKKLAIKDIIRTVRNLLGDRLIYY